MSNENDKNLRFIDVSTDDLLDELLSRFDNACFKIVIETC